MAVAERKSPALGPELQHLHFRQFLFQQLLVVEIGVVAVTSDEFVVGAEFDDASLVEDGDAVGVTDGRDAVRDEDGGASLHDLAQVVEDLVFGVRVHAGESVVENEDARTTQQRACDGGTLLLASGESDAALSYCRVVAFGKAFDVLGNIGGFGGGFDFFETRIVSTEGDVLADGKAEQECLLRDEADIAAQSFERKFSNWTSIDQDGARFGVINTSDQADQRGLSGTGWANDRQAGAGRNPQVDVVENGNAVVTEVEIAEFDFSAKFRVLVPVGGNIRAVGQGKLRLRSDGR